MKTNRFNLLMAIFAILMSASTAKAQLEALLIEAYVKWIMNEHNKSKDYREKIEEIQPAYETWIKLLEDYTSKTGTIGDCGTIGFKQLSNNRNDSKYFSYECGIKENIAFLKVKNKVKIGNCNEKSEFKAEFDIRKNSLDVFSFPMGKDDCVFFQPSRRTLRLSRGTYAHAEGGSGGMANMLGGLMDGSAGSIGTKAKGSLKAPSARDIDMGSDASRSKTEIMAVVNSNMPDLRNLYDKYLKLKPGFSGKVTLKFTIAPSGNIVSISIASSTTGYVKFDNDVKNMVATWKWKSIKNGNTEPTIPFNFEE